MFQSSVDQRSQIKVTLNFLLQIGKNSTVELQKLASQYKTAPDRLSVDDRQSDSEASPSANMVAAGVFSQKQIKYLDM